MTDPRTEDSRLSIALRHAAARGATDKHRLMLRVATVLADIEQTLSVIQMAIDRDDLELTKLRLKRIVNALGCGNVVTNAVDINANHDDDIDPALIVLKFEETIRLRSGLGRSSDVQDNESRIYKKPGTS
jgi:hypothetical protein